MTIKKYGQKKLVGTGLGLSMEVLVYRILPYHTDK